MSKKPIYNINIYIGSGFPILSVLSLEPQEEGDKPVGYIEPEESED